MQRVIPLIPFIFVLLWSTGFIASKFVIPFVEPFSILAIRVALAAMAFGLLAMIWRKAVRVNRTSAQHMLVGALIHGLYLGGVFFGIKQGVPAGIGALIVGLQPIVTASVLAIFQGQRLPRRVWLGLTLGFLGVALVIAGRAGDVTSTSISTIGLAAMFIALFGIVAGTVLQKTWQLGGNLIAASFWQNIGAFAFFVVASLSFENQMIAWNTTVILGLIWMVLGLSVAAILLLLFMIENGETARVASYFYLVPPVVMIQSYFLFDERLSNLSLIGAGLVVLALALVNGRSWGRRHPK